MFPVSSVSFLVQYCVMACYVHSGSLYSLCIMLRLGTKWDICNMQYNTVHKWNTMDICRHGVLFPFSESLSVLICFLPCLCQYSWVMGLPVGPSFLTCWSVMLLSSISRFWIFILTLLAVSTGNSVVVSFLCRVVRWGKDEIQQVIAVKNYIPFVGYFQAEMGLSVAVVNPPVIQYKICL